MSVYRGPGGAGRVIGGVLAALLVACDPVTLPLTLVPPEVTPGARFEVEVRDLPSCPSPFELTQLPASDDAFVVRGVEPEMPADWRVEDTQRVVVRERGPQCDIRSVGCASVAQLREEPRLALEPVPGEGCPAAQVCVEGACVPEPPRDGSLLALEDYASVCGFGPGEWTWGEPTRTALQGGTTGPVAAAVREGGRIELFANHEPEDEFLVMRRELDGVVTELALGPLDGVVQQLTPVPGEPDLAWVSTSRQTYQIRRGSGDEWMPSTLQELQVAGVGGFRAPFLQRRGDALVLYYQRPEGQGEEIGLARFEDARETTPGSPLRVDFQALDCAGPDVRESGVAATADGSWVLYSSMRDGRCDRAPTQTPTLYAAYRRGDAFSAPYPFRPAGWREGDGLREPFLLETPTECALYFMAFLGDDSGRDGVYRVPIVPR